MCILEASFRLYCFYIFLFLGSEGVAMAQWPPLRTLVMAMLARKEMPCVENLQITYCVNCRNTNIPGYYCQRSVFCDCYRNMGHFLCSIERIKRFVNVHLHCIVSNVHFECANTQDHQNCCAVKSNSRVLATFQSNGKTRKQEAI